MYSAYKLNKQGNNMQPRCTLFPIWNQSVVPYFDLHTDYMGSIPGLELSPGGKHGNPFQYSCLENPMDRGAWFMGSHSVRDDWSDWVRTHNPYVQVRKSFCPVPATTWRTVPKRPFPHMSSPWGTEYWPAGDSALRLGWRSALGLPPGTSLCREHVPHSRGTVGLHSDIFMLSVSLLTVAL